MKRLAVAAACTLAILLSLWLPLLAYVHCDAMKEWKRVAASWITGEETRHLMRYHGAAVLRSRRTGSTSFAKAAGSPCGSVPRAESPRSLPCGLTQFSREYGRGIAGGSVLRRVPGASRRSPSRWLSRRRRW